MAWEARRNSRRFYYRKERCGGKVRSVYLGSGPVGEIAAETDALRREDRAAAAEETRKTLEALDAAAALTAGTAAWAGLLGEAVMICAGFRRHGTKWRKSREPKKAVG